MPKTEAEITLLLQEFNKGSEDALKELAAVVYDELRKVARAYMRNEKANHTLQPTALVNEAFMRLFKGKPVDWEGRSHFFRVAALVMRRILVDHARGKKAARRGDNGVVIPFSERIH